jgi:hypothetical protein
MMFSWPHHDDLMQAEFASTGISSYEHKYDWKDYRYVMSPVICTHTSDIGLIQLFTVIGRRIPTLEFRRSGAQVRLRKQSPGY